MPIQVNKIFNANIYLDGTNNLIGRAAEVTLPEISVATSEHSGLGMVGTLELPAGLQAMTLQIKWSGFYADHMKAGANPFKAHKFQVRGSVETYGAEGRVAEAPVVWHVTASWKKAALGGVKPKEAAEFEDELAATYVKVVHDGEELLEVDVLQNIWRAAGEDVLANYRKNIGG
jgi:P2 family phage contractile tail tube protein